MTDKKLIQTLRKIDGGYTLTEEEQINLLKIEKVSWNAKEETNSYIKLKSIIDDYEIKSVPNSIGELTNLRSLRLAKTQIRSLPETVSKNAKLELLDLRGTQIEEIPECIESLKSLRVLSVADTKINHIPEWIGNLNSIEVLDLSGTQIEAFPNCIERLTNLKELNLSETKIDHLPGCIGKLENLKRLILTRTRIDELPECVGQLANLEVLWLYETKIKYLPEVIGNLNNLEELSLSRTQIIELPESVSKLKNLKHLHLWDVKINELPEWIGNLKNLSQLMIEDTNISNLPESIGELKNLLYLSIAYNPISNLPECIKKLTKLQELSLSGTSISELPIWISNLIEMRKLSLINTKVATLPKCIGELSNLQELYISGNNIKKLPKQIGRLTSLEVLSLSRNPISELPKEIGNLNNLKELYMSATQIKEIPEEIRLLTNLKDISLGGDHIEKLPEWICDLTSLRYFTIEGTQMKAIPDQIGKLTNLKALYLGHNLITELPEWIGNLWNLEVLDIYNNPITELPDCIGRLTNLQALDLSKTIIKKLPQSVKNLSNMRALYLGKSQLRELPEWIGTLSKLQKIVIEDLELIEIPKSLMSLNLEFRGEEHFFCNNKEGVYIRNLKLQKQPVSLFFQPREFIENYYKQKRVAVNETKVIFLGSEGVGKTHTIKRILNDGHKISESLKETPGISINSKTFVTDNYSYRVNFWDFGGQEIMHAMHRCFLTDRTGYVIVVSTRFGDINKQARYWLKNLESFTKNAPVIVYVNEWSEGTLYRLDEYSLQRDYPNILDIKRCSSRDGNDECFNEVIEAIQTMVLINDGITLSFPESWENVRQEIIELGKEGNKKYYISQQEFRDNCNRHGICNEDIQTWLLEWFNDLGECFSYQFEERTIRPYQDLKVLNPEWLTNAIYIIIREAGDFAVNGFVSHEGICNKLDHSDKGTMKNVHYSEDECNYVLEVMRKFKLSYKVVNKKEEFIPALLCESMPTDIAFRDAKSVIRYEMRYKYLPENVIQNLMIMMYPYLDHHRCWRRGVVIDVRSILNIGLLAIVDMSQEDEILRIKVLSYQNHAPWQLLQEIRGCLLDINKGMNLIAKDYIIIDSNDIYEAVSVEKLLRLKKRGVSIYQGDEEDYVIDKLLGDFYGMDQVQRIEGSDRDNRNDGSSEVDNPTCKTSGELEIPAMINALQQPSEERLLGTMSNISEPTCKTVYKYIISACAQIQSDSKYKDEKENSRSTQVRTILGNRGLIVRDQTLYGNARGSDNPGEVDLLVMRNSTDALTIIEAMNIKSVNKNYILQHLLKLLNDYNPCGLPELFLVSYVQKAKDHFQDFWHSYRDYINRLNAESYRFVEMTEDKTGYHYIKHVIVTYDCNGARTIVHHICMRAGD